ncbi:hypothetical protein A8708_30235 [Paenibacillus oryzisoli]|uniref:Tyr recombinase domain-containing protein n=1 Tax=Paenibacillus oryzisoli TaxID=1850517 RepID=A0A198AK76_9BACL|nr:hypothetical protein A8708_30235 [Paenibacillus oryzisoli]
MKDPVTGKRKQKESTGFTSAKAAEKEGIRIQASLMEGLYVEKVKVTVGQWCDDWLVWYTSTGRVKQSTIDSRSTSIGMLKAEIGGLYLQELTDEIYQNTLLKMVKKYKPNTLTLFHGVAGMIFKRAVQKEKLKVNPAQYAYIPKKVQSLEEREASKTLPRFLEKNELKLFLDAVEGVQFRRVFELLAYSGLRIGELSALFVTDFSKDEGTIEISKTRYSNGNITEYELLSPKTKSSDRTVHLSKKAISAINSQINWRKSFAFSKGTRFYQLRTFLFVMEKRVPGYPLTNTIISANMYRALKKAGLPLSLTPHSLRHTYTSLMAEAGAELDTIQAQLGHKKGSDITRAIYLHVTKAREKRDVQRLDAFLDSND